MRERGDTDRVDTGALPAGRLLALVLVHLTVGALAARLAGAGVAAGELCAGSIVETGLSVALGDIVLAAVALPPHWAGAVEVGDVVRAGSSVLAGVGRAETLSDTVLSLLALRPHTPDLLAPGSGVSRRTGAASSREAGPSVTTAAGL